MNSEQQSLVNFLEANGFEELIDTRHDFDHLKLIMVVLDEKENFILDVPLEGDVDSTVREEERKKTGRYLAVSVVLFLVAVGLYHAISYGSTQMSALLGAALIMFLYLLWLLYAAQRRKKTQKKCEKKFEKQITHVLQNLNNLKTVSITNLSGPHENLVYDDDDEDDQILQKPIKNEERITKEAHVEEYKEQNVQKDENGSRKSSKGSEIFIRTYSIA